MFYGTYYPMSAGHSGRRKFPLARAAEDGKVVGFGNAGCKDNFPRLAGKLSGNFRTRVLQRVLCLNALAMYGTRIPN